MRYSKVQLLWGPGVDDKVTFNLNDILPTDPYVVDSITGLEPPLQSLAIEGGVYQGRSSENREIVINLSFQPNYSIGEDAGVLRKRLYPMLTPKLASNVRFRLLNAAETEWVQTTGQIKRIEPNIFTKDPSVQIVMSCLSSYFESPEIIFASPATLNAKNPLPVTNDGDAPMGINITLVLTGASASFTLTNSGLSTQFLRVTYAFLANDKLIINTNPGARSLTRVRSGANLNLLPNFSGEWLMMDPGLNNFIPSTTAYTVEALRYTPKHWGF